MNRRPSGLKLDKAVTGFLLPRQGCGRIGNKYVVIGMMERPAWRVGMHEPEQLADMLKFIADLKEGLSFTVRPAGWHLADEK